MVIQDAKTGIQGDKFYEKSAKMEKTGAAGEIPDHVAAP